MCSITHRYINIHVLYLDEYYKASIPIQVNLENLQTFSSESRQTVVDMLFVISKFSISDFVESRAALMLKSLAISQVNRPAKKR